MSAALAMRRGASRAWSLARIAAVMSWPIRSNSVIVSSSILIGVAERDVPVAGLLVERGRHLDRVHLHHQLHCRLDLKIPALSQRPAVSAMQRIPANLVG